MKLVDAETYQGIRITIHDHPKHGYAWSLDWDRSKRQMIDGAPLIWISGFAATLEQARRDARAAAIVLIKGLVPIESETAE